MRVDATNVEGDRLKSPYPSLVGARGGVTLRVDHRECARSRKSRRPGDETFGSEGNARMFEASRMPHHRRTVEDGV